VAFAQDGVIVGTARDTLTKAPLSGVTVEANDPISPRTVITGADGAFRFDHLAPANYRLKYTLPGYLGSDAKSTAFVSIKAGAVVERVTLELTPFARMEGAVLDEEGLPLPGVMVYTDTSLRATTGQDGRYTITQLEPGSYRIVLRTPYEIRRRTLKRYPETGETFGYANTEYYPGTADVQAALPVTLSGGLELRGFDVRLHRVRLVEFGGRTLERAGAEPLTDARVELLPSVATLNDDTFKVRTVSRDGGFRFDLIQPGSYTLAVYRSADSKALPYLLPVELGKAGIQDLKVAVPPFPTISGSVLAPPDTEWAGQVIVSVRSASLVSASRDFNVTSEKFTIEELPPGRWMVQVDSNTLKRPAFEKLFIKAASFGTQNAMGETLNVTESGNPPLEIQLTPEHGRISGTAFGADGLPLKRAMVLTGRAAATIALSRGQVSLSRDDGSFVVEDLAPGTYRLVVGSDGRFTGFRDGVLVEVKAGETAVVRVQAKAQSEP
jgi:hypothetical protein